ncbi:MAG: DNA mismatch repair protein MutS [Spirochaetales bacterium]|nr:DNA mismatch repair protein MutS [Spirochaetales bacterium]
MMRQYKKIKEQYRDTILFFRLGDFYEMFEQDAKEASQILDITLTKRNDIPMCGIPYHAAQNYIAKLLKAQKKIAICEQTHIPKPGKGIATREVVEVITPGTVIDENLLERNENNYIVSIGRYKGEYAIAYIDCSTAEFFAGNFSPDERVERLKQELLRLSPKEIIVSEALVEEDDRISRILFQREGLIVNRYPDWSFDYDANHTILKNQLGVSNLKGFGIREDSALIPVAGVLLDYIRQTSKSMLPHIRSIEIITDASFVCLDESTQRNLELVSNLQDGSKRYTLLEVLDFTKTSMGARRLKKWILHPLVDEKEIETRLDSVGLLYRNQMLLSQLRDLLGRILDLERISAKIATEKAHAKDLLSIRFSLEGIISIFDLLSPFKAMEHINKAIGPLVAGGREIIGIISESIAEEPSILLTEGNLIKKGYHKELDNLRELTENVREVLQKLLIKEKKKTGISSLKLRYNRIIGYYFEVTKSNLNLVPEYFIRRQSLVSGERFSTDELVEKESEINSASERIVSLEKELFLGIRDRVKDNISMLLDLADSVAKLDVLHSFAFSATTYGFSRPVLKNEASLEIKGGRHPVVEAHMRSGSFVPNSITMSDEEGLFILLTGPNMAGKSTFLRQVALIVHMAHCGCFIPADEAVIGIVDKIFCRVGAMDNLARGESTFLVEMNETANILRSATDKSLLILDEVGRGTSTNDGLSIAWAVTEYILSRKHAKTLFATHYHELTSIVHPQLVNYSMSVLERGEDIVFLKRVKKGPADNSYGIHVARLAGLPEEVIDRAEDILHEICGKREVAGNKTVREPVMKQSMLFSSSELVIREIEGFDIDTVTPLEALTAISRWKKELAEEKK